MRRCRLEVNTADNYFPPSSPSEELEELRQIYLGSPCGYLTLGPTGQLLRANPAAQRMLGVQLDDVREGLHALLTERSQREYALALPWFIERGHVEGFDIELAAANGRPLKVLSLTAKTVYDGTEPKAIHVALYDISELRVLKEELTALTMEQSAMLHSDLLGIMRLQRRRIVWKNRTLERMLGYEHDELLGRSTRLLYPDDDTYYEVGHNAYPVVNEGGLWRKQVRMVRKDGAEVWVDMNGTLLSVDKDESLWLVQDVTELKQYQLRVEHQAFHDELTGLPNRALLTDRMRQALLAAGRRKSPVAVCYMDLDGFKPINDRLGHQAGDELLVELGHRLQKCIRGGDTVARVGGDEFVVVAAISAEAEIPRLMTRLLGALASPVTLNSGEVAQVTASIGVARYPHDAGDAQRLLSMADSAMYRAKRAGKNQFETYSPLALPNSGD